MKQISHDTFARTTLVRETISAKTLQAEAYWRHGKTQTCDWCGNLNSFGGLFRYATDPDDGGRIQRHDGAFCSISCHNSYHS